MKIRRLKYAMVGGARGSFIGPVRRMAVRLDDLADLVEAVLKSAKGGNRRVGV